MSTSTRPELEPVAEEQRDPIEAAVDYAMKRHGKVAKLLLAAALAFTAGGGGFFYALVSLPDVVERNTEAIQEIKIAIAGERDRVTGEIVKPGFVAELRAEGVETRAAMTELTRAVNALSARVNRVERNTEAVRANVVPGPPSDGR